MTAAPTTSPDGEAPAALRPLSPTGAPGVGAPPVAAHAVVSVPPRQGEDAAAAARRAFPHLTAEQVQAALDQAALDPAPLTPRPGWLDALWLALPLGAGMQMLASAVTAVLTLVAMVTADRVQDDGVSGASDGALEALLVAGILTVGGVGLVQLEPWARFSGALLGAAVAGRAAVAGGAGYGLGLGLCWLALIAPGVGRWTTVDARAARDAAVTRPFLQATLWGWIVLGLLVAVVPAFARMFREVGVALPGLTQLTIEASSLAAAWQLLLAPALLVGSLPLLRLHPRHEAPASWAIGTLGLALTGTIAGSVTLALVGLIENL